MEGTINNLLSYKGIVSLVVKTKNQIHYSKVLNEGTDKLHELLAQVLCGRNIANRIPKKVNIINKSTSVSILVNSGVSITGATYGKELAPQLEHVIGNCAQFNIFITKDNLIQTGQLPATTELELQLCNYQGDVLACVADENSELLTAMNALIEPSDNLIITWQLIFTNQVSTVEGTLTSETESDI